MTPKESQKRYDAISEKLRMLRIAKNTAYGNGFMKQYNTYGEKALFFDMLRKWQRIESILMSNNENNVSDETIQDTLGDLSVMCINGMIWLDEKNKVRNK